MEKDDEFVCSVCKKKETDGTKVLTCMYCFSSAHFKCKNIVGNAIRRMRENDYFCSSDCSAIYQRIVMMQNNNNTLLSSLASTISSSVSMEMKSVKDEVNLITNAIEKSQDFLSQKFDNIVTDFKNLRIENEQLKSEIVKLKKSHTVMQHTVHKLEANVDKTDKTALGNNAIIWGIPTTPDENVSELVQKFLCNLGMTENFDFVVSAERFFSNKSSNALVPIRIVFRDKESKELVFSKKKQMGQILSTLIDSKLVINGRAMNVTLRDELTPLSLEMLKELRDSQVLLNIKYVWVGRGGVVLVKKDDNSKPESVKNREDLIRIMTNQKASSHVPKPASKSPSPKRKKSTQ